MLDASLICLLGGESRYRQSGITSSHVSAS